MSIKRIVECVPNISCGNNPEIYTRVAHACEKVAGVKLLDIDPGVATNRTVITFAGAPEVIVDAAFEVIKAAKESIDMRTHKGEHPRMGATDVCPFVPVSGVTLEECAELARKLGERVGRELGVWVYLYEAAATKSEWKNLANIRKGEYESLAAREGKTEWKPDFGPTKLDPAFGAIAIGARKFLVAYNININSNNKKWAQDIAMNIRESGRSQRASYPDGPIVRNADGTPVQVAGLFQHCKAGAWVIPEYNRAQITMNLTDIDVTPVHTVFDEVCKQANERGIRITGSEIVGLVPLQTMLEAGRHYCRQQGLSIAQNEVDLVNMAIISLGLSDVTKFNPEDKIVEYRLAKGRARQLVDQTLLQFADTLASDAPAPGGGSIAALNGALAAGLLAMVTNLTHGKNEYREQWERMETVGFVGQQLKAWFLDAVDRDTDAFNVVMAAMKLPKGNEEEKRARNAAIESANQLAASIPLEVLKKSAELLPHLRVVIDGGNPNCLSDIGVAIHTLLTCAEGAAMNVRINVKGLNNVDFKTTAQSQSSATLQLVRKECAQLLELLEKKF